MGYLVNSMAQGDVSMAAYYYRRQAYLAAANRAQDVVKTYPQTAAVEEALFIMSKSYQAMGLKDLSNDALRVLQKSFPNSHFLTGGAAIERPWWRLFW
jgi:outer membrane protein assembly factor BamD